MLTVRDLMSTDPLTIDPDETLRAAVEMLVSAGTGGAPVVSGGRLVGVISLSDVLSFTAETTERKIREEPEFDAALGDGDDSPESVAAEEGAGRWFREMWEGSGAETVLNWEEGGPEWDELDQHSVSELMTRAVVHVAPDDPVEQAARVMDRAAVHRVIVTQNGKVVGVLGARDVVRAVAQGLLVPKES